MKKALLWGGLALVPACALGQQDAVVVTATRAPQPSLDVIEIFRRRGPLFLWVAAVVVLIGVAMGFALQLVFDALATPALQFDSHSVVDLRGDSFAPGLELGDEVFVERH